MPKKVNSNPNILGTDYYDDEYEYEANTLEIELFKVRGGKRITGGYALEKPR